MTHQPIPEHLRSYLTVADELPERLSDCPVEEIERLQTRLRDLVALCANREGQIAKLADRLHLITHAALTRIDGDSQPHDTHWSEIVGLANGDPNWLRSARLTYEQDHASLVALARHLVESLIDSLPEEGPIDEAWKAREAESIADSLEQEILPAMELAEDGRTFLRGQGKPYEVERA